MGVANITGNLLNDTGLSLSSYLPLTGGTLTGALNGTSAAFSSSVTAASGLYNGYTSGLPPTSGSATRGGLRLNNASNIAFDFGTVAAGQAWIQVSDANNYASNFALLLNPNGGNVGIGTTNPETLLHVNSSNVGGEGGYLYLDNPAASTLGNKAGIKFGTSGGASFSTTPTGEITNVIDNAGNGASALTFGTFNGSSSGERMRITSEGNVLINKTSQSNVRFYVRSSTQTSSDYAIYADNSVGDLFWIRNDGVISTGNRANSPYNNTTANAANLNVASDGTLSRSTSSLKYKKDVKDYDKGLAEVMAIRPVYYKGKGENDRDKQFAGLIAEEIHDLGLTEFVQYAKDGSPDALAYQNMIALLTKAIQELNAKVTALENK